MELIDFVPPGMGVTSMILLIALGFVGAFIAAAFSMGGGQLMIAALAQVLPPAALIPVHGLVQLGANSGRVAILWKHIVWTGYVPFVVGNIIGASLGAYLYVQIPPWLIQICVGSFILWSVIGKMPAISGRYVFGVGIIASFLTMFFGSTAHFIAAIVRAMNLQPAEHVATHAVMMALQHGLKIVAFGILGFGFAPYLPFVGAIIFVGFFGTWLGKQLLLSSGQVYFRPVLNIILLVLGTRLLWLGVQDLVQTMG